MAGGAGMEDGMESIGMRKDFRDNPAFETLETDENGVANVTFTLADKITSWRVTVHGITEDNFAGNVKENIISTLPFNIDIVMLNEFIDGDDISITAKPYGKEYKHIETEITYTAEILQDDKIIFSKTEKSNKLFNLNAGKLPEGDYIIRITAQTDSGLRDGMEKEFKVIKSGIVLLFKTNEVISETNPTLRKFDVKTSPGYVTMYNYDRSIIMNALSSCVDKNSNRTDYAAAEIFRNKYLYGLYGKEPLKINSDDYESVISSWSWRYGISELPQGMSDPFYTARFAACFPESVDAEGLREYFQQYLTGGFYDDEYTESCRAAGYFAMASIGDTVLLKIYEQIDIILNSENQEKFTGSYQSHMRVLYYAAALCVIGDDNKASDLIIRSCSKSV